MAVYLDKVGALPLESDEDEPMRWGKRFEEPIVEEFQERTGLFVSYRQSQATHISVPFLRATLDGLVYGEPQDSRFTHPADGLYEAKSASRRSWEWRDAIPDHVAVQVQHNLNVTGHERAWLAALLLSPIPHLVIHVVERDPDAIERLVEIESEFWRRVQRHEPPSTDGSEASAVALRQAFADSDPNTTIELTDDALFWIRERHLAHKALKTAEARKTLAENNVMSFLGRRELGYIGGEVRVSWVPSSRSSFDLERFRERCPIIAKRYTTSTTTRRLYFKPARGVFEEEDDD
jgi:predicted phage-related endonuclease